MKLLKGLCLIALMVAFTIPAFAETQSIKLSGDLAIRAINRDDYDFNKEALDTAHTDGNYFMHNAEVQLDADLTDNVSVTIRLVNQTDWNVSIINIDAAGEFEDRDRLGLGTQHDELEEFDVLLDLGYVTLKEFFFTPLTVRIGKQDIWFGKGFIVGANYHDPNEQISADEYTSFTSFKAIRATWDFEPWTLDAVYAMIEENEVQADDDRDLFGLNLGCILDYYNAEVEGYYWYVEDDEIPNRLTAGVTPGAVAPVGATEHDTSKENRIHTLGLRGSFEPHEDITVWSEYAMQRGVYIADEWQREPRDREAFAFDIGSECRLWEEQYAWRPVLGAEYIFYSGQNHDDDRLGHDYHAWDRMFRGKVDSAIHEWYNVFYTLGMPTTERADENLQQLILMGSIQPMDNLTIDARWINFRLHENWPVNPNITMGSSNKNVGNELDLEMTYEYTEDVTFGLLAGWFFPGDYYTELESNTNAASVTPGAPAISNEKDIASKLVATCRVSF
jgi:hypothetical protein